VRKQRPKATPIGDKLLTLEEVAQILRLNARTVREYVQRGEIEGRLIGGRWRFRRADLDIFFEEAPRDWEFEGNRGHGK
jgi:excisionase family DNA binding protein